MPNFKNKLFIISGPSGAGKDSVINEVKKFFSIEKIVTTTTRAMRPGEIEGVDYYFLSEEEFKKRIDEGRFFEWAQQYNDNYYGVTFEEIERVKQSEAIGLWNLDYKGTVTIKKLMPEIKSIFITASLDILEKRIRARDKVTDEFVAERMKYTKEWLKHQDIYDFVVENNEGKLDEAVAKVLEIIKNN
ncbi:MAG: guanylate kinase [Patescibacteria group bacterium]